jgi:hypothetical protein
MIKDVEQAHAALADALWWLKGFSSALPENPDARAMAESLRQVREYLTRIADGWVRRIGAERAFVMSYADFEVLYDGIAHPRSTDTDRERAAEKMRALLAQYQAEACEAAANPQIPF